MDDWSHTRCRGGARPQTQQPTDNHPKKHKLTQPAAAPATAKQSPAPAVAGPAATKPKKPKKEKQPKTHGNGNLEAAAGEPAQGHDSCALLSRHIDRLCCACISPDFFGSGDQQDIYGKVRYGGD